MSHKHSAILILAIVPFWHSAVSAEDNTKTYGSSFAPPVFQSVDAQGVDLVHGKMRISTPVMQIGEGQSRHERGLLWTGQAWSIIGQPSIWRDGSKYIVIYRGRSEEFNDRKSGYSGRKPVMGGKLTCNVTDPGNIATSCMYTDRDGDVVVFNGVPSNSVSVASSYGTASLFLGNLGMYNAYVRSVNRPMQFFGEHSFDRLGPDRSADSGGTYNSGNKKLSLLKQSLTISTPNQNGKNSEDSYLRPKSVTQSITDANNSVWKYTFNDNRDLTRIDFPAGAASITIEYNSDNKVQYVKTAAGNWTYQYSDQNNDYAFTTVIDPDLNRKKVRYHKESGIVTNYYEDYDSLSQAFRRETKYELDGNFRVTKVTYPEANYTTYKYDSRGNVTEKVTYPKPGSNISSTLAFISTSATYSSDCIYYTTCNQPLSTSDELKNVTSFEYSPPKKARIDSPWGNGDGYDYEYGPNGPIKITLPKLSTSGVVPEVVLSYKNGKLIEKVECREKSPCIGSTDAVITTYKYEYADSSGLLDLSGLIEMTVASDGKTLRTCYGLDNNGRRISETPPAAGISECPSDITTALEPKSTPPSTDRTPTPPVWADGTKSDDTSNPTDPSPTDPGGEGDPCTRRPGYQCQ